MKENEKGKRLQMSNKNVTLFLFDVSTKFIASGYKFLKICRNA